MGWRFSLRNREDVLHVVNKGKESVWNMEIGCYLGSSEKTKEARERKWFGFWLLSDFSWV